MSRTGERTRADQAENWQKIRSRRADQEQDEPENGNAADRFPEGFIKALFSDLRKYSYAESEE